MRHAAEAADSTALRVRRRPDPRHDGRAICRGLALLLLDMARRPGDHIIDIVPGYPVDRVRNQICKRFLESDAEYLLCRKARKAGFSIWLDTDQPCSHVKALDVHASVSWAQQYAARQRIVDLGF